jgi:carboxypeptidase Taq
MSAQIFDAAQASLPELEAQIAQGNMSGLREWLRTNIHQYGRAFSADELMHQMCGESLQAQSWLQYIRKKYGEIYGF